METAKVWACLKNLLQQPLWPHHLKQIIDKFQYNISSVVFLYIMVDLKVICRKTIADKIN